MVEVQPPKRSLWVISGSVGAIIVIVAAIFAGPSLVECSQSASGFGTCVQGKLADLGVGSRPATQTAAEPAAKTQTVQTAPVTPAPVAVAAPDFGVRVQPDGSLVVVGSGAKGKKVEIYANGVLLGAADVDPNGDWVLVPDAPLPPGGYELTIVDPATGKPADKTFVVAINEDKTSEPLVVASTPGHASQILQGLGQKTTAPVAVAAAAPATATAGSTPAPAVESQAATAPAEPAIAVADAGQAATDAINRAAEKAGQIAALASAPAIADVVAQNAPVAPAAQTKPPKTEVASASSMDQAIGNVDKLQKQIESLRPVTAPTIDAIEIDKGRNYFAGTGEEGAVIRLYVDNVFVGDTTVKNGHWLLDIPDVLKDHSQRVRVDELATGSANVAARAEVDFIFQAPSVAQPDTATAEAQPLVPPKPGFGIDTNKPVIVPVAPTPAQQTSPAAPAPLAVAEAAPATVAPKPATSKGTGEPASASNAPTPVNGAAPAGAAPAGTASTGTASTGAGGVGITVPQPDFSIDTGIPVVVIPAPATSPNRPATVASEPKPAVQPSAEQAPAAQAPAAQAPATEPPAADIPQLIAIPVGNPELGRFASGKAIIRRGDNLWTIALRVYGSGVRYTQIYGANKGQIRDPNLIYPGQVFDLPGIGGQTTSK